MIGYALDQKIGRSAADFFARLSHEGQTRLEVFCPFEIINSQDCNIFGNTQAAFANRPRWLNSGES